MTPPYDTILFFTVVGAISAIAVWAGLQNFRPRTFALIIAVLFTVGAGVIVHAFQL